MYSYKYRQELKKFRIKLNLCSPLCIHRCSGRRLGKRCCRCLLSGDHGDQNDDHGDENDDHGDQNDDHGDENDDHGDENEDTTQ